MIALFSDCATNEVITYEPINEQSGDDYKTFVTPEETDIPFSFEYPSYYYYPVSYRPPELGLPLTIVQLHPISIEGWSEGIFVDIEIWITPIDGDFPDAETAVEEHLSLFEDKPGSYFNDIEPDSLMIEKYRVIVAEVEGWETRISYRELPFPDVATDAVPRANTSVVHRDVFFDCKDMMWHIELYSDASSYGQFRYDFEHILRTLKILE